MSDSISETKNLKANQILFLADSDEKDLYFIKSGKVLVFVQNGSQITPVAYINSNEFIGELSFFDNSKRSASILTIEDSEIVKISSVELHKFIPKWLQQVGSKLSKKIRHNDEIIRSKGLRKTKVESIKPLSIEEQTKIYKLVEEFKKTGVK